MDAKRSLVHNWLTKSRRDLLSDWFNIAVQVSPYATAYRYPGEVLEPTGDEYKQAFKAASKFYEFICSLLPPELSVPKK
ncbi:MAG: hypothetical protein COY47_03545 [Chloroflexi bacterium CG_4_10_14_0_8_um_filter_57_5]|nr:MAG: hypothetical protein COY47_03545 [Chloroflexi bacterium CG_4_10_14_0_8_um_filter_57_5]